VNFFPHVGFSDVRFVCSFELPYRAMLKVAGTITREFASYARIDFSIFCIRSDRGSNFGLWYTGRPAAGPYDLVTEISKC